MRGLTCVSFTGCGPVLAGFLAVSPLVAIADDATSGAANTSPPLNLIDNVRNGTVFSFDYSVPTSPALTLAGLSADKTATSTPAKPFVLSSPTTTGGGGGSAFAADVAPAWLFPDITERQYETDPSLQILYRTRVASAIYEGNDGGGNQSKAQPSELAIGLSTSLLRDNDPILATAPQYSGTVFDGCLAPYHDLHYEFTQDELATARNSDAVQVVRNQISQMTTINTSEERDKALRLIHDTNVLQSGGSVSSTPYAPSAAEHNQTNDEVSGELREAKAEWSTQGDDIQSKYLAKYQASLDAAYKRQAAPIIKKCVTAANNAAAESAALNIGLGAIWTGTPGKFSGFEKPSAAAWVGWRIPFDAVFDTKSTDTLKLTSYWAVGGSAHFVYHGNVATGSKVTPKIEANSTDAWIALEHFSDWLKLEGEAGYTDVSAVEASQKSFSKSGFRWLATADLKVPYVTDSGVWLGIAYGTAQSKNTSLKGNTLLVTLNFGPPSNKDLFGIGS